MDRSTTGNAGRAGSGIRYAVYRYGTGILFILLFPLYLFFSWLTGRNLEGMGERLGVYPALPPLKRPLIWLHAVSVGEMGVALSIIDALRRRKPGCAVVVTTVTPQGKDIGRRRLPRDIPCHYAPLDFIPAVIKALKTLKPDILVSLETEIWPNRIMEAHRRGIPTAIVNGRISERSIKRYLRLRSFMAEILSHIDFFSMIGDLDAQRISSMGAPGKRIRVNGNAKYDALIKRSTPDLPDRIRRIYAVPPSTPVFVAGSVRGREESAILEACRLIHQFLPETLILLAPRHIRRAPKIADQFRRAGLPCICRGEFDGTATQREAPIVIIDTMGELHAVYGIATTAFIGGSLVPLGGQNIMEAAVWGVPVLHGPHMSDFRDAGNLLEQTGGSITVQNARDLAETALGLLNNPQRARTMGEHARKAVLLNAQAAEHHAQAVLELLHDTDIVP